MKQYGIIKLYLKAVKWTLEVQKEEPNVSFKRKTEQLSGRLYLKRKIAKLRYKMASVFVPGKRKRYSQVQLLSLLHPPK